MLQPEIVEEINEYEENTRINEESQQIIKETIQMNGKLKRREKNTGIRKRKQRKCIKKQEYDKISLGRDILKTC